MDQSTSLTPEKINTLFQVACDLHQENKLGEAQAIYLQLLEHIDVPLLHYNIGLVYYSLEQFKEARNSFSKAHHGCPDDVDILFNLALSQKSCGNIEDAITMYCKLLEIEPRDIDTLYNLAGCYREQRYDEMAIASYHEVLKLAPDHKSATNNLAYMYHLTGNREQAIVYYQNLLKLAPDHEPAEHMLSSLLGSTPDAPPESYLIHLFDNYSEHYEESLVQKLNYSVPEQLRNILDQIEACPSRFPNGIDLGCGTGLSGLAFQDIVEVFEGVDISVKMVTLAKSKGVYSYVHTGTIESRLSLTPDRYDFILAADVFSYMGNLSKTFQLISKCSNSQCYFLFSTESDDIRDFTIRPTGRYAHGHAYIYEIAKTYNWEILLQQQANLRKEKGDWIRGDLWILRKC